MVHLLTFEEPGFSSKRRLHALVEKRFCTNFSMSSLNLVKDGHLRIQGVICHVSISTSIKDFQLAFDERMWFLVVNKEKEALGHIFWRFLGMMVTSYTTIKSPPMIWNKSPITNLNKTLLYQQVKASNAI